MSDLIPYSIIGVGLVMCVLAIVVIVVGLTGTAAGYEWCAEQGLIGIADEGRVVCVEGVIAP